MSLRVERKRKAHESSERAACPLGTQQSQVFEIASLRYRVVCAKGARYANAMTTVYQDMV